jgi:hypothetical protein
VSTNPTDQQNQSTDADKIWAPDFQRLILAAALRGDLLQKIPLDPTLFGTYNGKLKTPRFLLAELIVKRPPLAEFKQMVADLGESLSPEERSLLQSETAEVLAVPNPIASPYMVGKICEQSEFRRLEQGLIQLDEVLEQGPAALGRAREILTKAMAPIEDDDDGLVTLTGERRVDTAAILPGLIYEDETVEMYAHGDSGKSMVAMFVGAITKSGIALPPDLTPSRPLRVAYLDWETDKATANDRLGRLTEGLGIRTPGILYKRMVRPLVDEIKTLAPELRRRGIGLVILDSMVYALGEGDNVVERVVAFFNACREFAPAARWVVNHVTGQDARGKPGTAHPFGGAFAHNGPRLVWQAVRNQDVPDALAMTFVCTKWNNLPQRPKSFALRFEPGEGGMIRVESGEISEEAISKASIPDRVRTILRGGRVSFEDLLKRCAPVKPDTLSRTLRRMKDEVVEEDGLWGLKA